MCDSTEEGRITAEGFSLPRTTIGLSGWPDTIETTRLVDVVIMNSYCYLDEPDYKASFNQLVKVMTLGDYPEAIYKVGDASTCGHKWW